MNRELVENILSVINAANDKSVIVRGLLKLRTDVVKDRDGIVLFREAGGVQKMIRFLNKPHEQILEVVLSIMGNCCTDVNSCKEALENKIVPPLTVILKSIPNPIIQCRACRLLGNLAKVDTQQLVIAHSSALGKALCQIIEDSSDVQTRMMAFRACRFLLSNPQFAKYFLQFTGFNTLLRILFSIMKNSEVRVNEDEKLLTADAQDSVRLGLKRNQHREKYFEEVARNLEGVRSDIFDYEVLKNSARLSNVYAMPEQKEALDLACEILKCLLVLSELQLAAPVWESVSRASCTFAPIVYFVSEDNKHRSVALKILSNFSKNPGAFYTLSSADAILAACELLVNNNVEKPLTESETRHCINIVSILSVDACNRSKIRRSGALRKLIAMLRESSSNSEKTSILYVFLNFQYDNMSMDLMLREGLITVLIKELQSFITSDEEYYKRKREEKLQSTKKRKLSESIKETKCKFPKVHEDVILDYDSPSGSPRSLITPPSPCSSRSMSPVIGGNLNKTSDFDEESYSPVCSDGSDDDDSDDEDGGDNNKTSNLYTNPNASLDNHSVIMNLLDLASRPDATLEDNILLDKEDDDEVSQDVPALKLPHIGNLPHNAIDIIDNLIFRVTYMVKKGIDLGKPETMNTLIKAINMFGLNMDFAGSLTNILLESQFFGQVVKQGMGYQLYQLTKMKELAKEGFTLLDTLTSVGECNYGKEELARLLRSDDILAQKRAAITVGFIIKSKPLLYQFLNDGNALSLLLNIILSHKCDEFTAEAVDSLTCMARYTLGIQIPQIETDKHDQEYEKYIENLDEPMHENCDMRFMVYNNHESDTDKDQNQDQDQDKNQSPVAMGFNKALLCSTSEVFNTMLNSDFREGNEGEIHLHTYTVSGLRFFLHLIVRKSLELKLNLIPPANKYHALLEAFEMSRIYIIPDMEQIIQELLILLLNENNCLSLFEWSMKNYHSELTEMAINYYLCSTLSTEAKVNLYHTADYSTYSSEWFQMLYDTVFAKCRTTF
uniref:ARMC5-like ARM-repeats domain-containing protein n=1 Tax=Glossina brevipalpis TaxID=37001 RepID=A0A1A9WPN1_9MUSC